MRHLLIVCLLGLGTAQAWGAGLLALQDASAPPGGTAEVAVALSAEVKDVIAGSLEVVSGAPAPADAPGLPPATGVVKGTLLPDLETALEAGGSGSLRVAFAGSQSGDGPGSLLLLRMPVPPDAPVGATYPLKIRAHRLEALDGTLVSVETAGATLRVVSPVPPDAFLFIPKAHGRAGSVVDLEVQANNLLPAVQSVDVTVSVVPNLRLRLPTPLFVDGSVRAGSLLPDPQVVARVTPGGALRVAMASGAEGPGPGTLFRFQMRLPEGLKPGVGYPLALSGSVGLGGKEWPIRTVGGDLLVSDTDQLPGWLLHLRSDPPLALSTTPGDAPAALPIDKLRWSVSLKGPILATPFRTVLHVASLTGQPATVRARLLLERAGGQEGEEIAAWTIGDVAPRTEGVSLTPRETLVEAAGLLDAVPGDTLSLELTAPPTTDGKPSVELRTGGPAGQEGDSQLWLGIGPPVTLEIEPGEMALPRGAEQQLAATVRVGDGPPVEGAAVTWSVRPEAAATITPDGLLTLTGSDPFEVVATYQGMEATARVSLTRPLVAAGDVSGDGSVNVADVLVVLRIILKLVEPSEAQSTLADINGDGQINVADAVRLLLAVVGRQPLPG